MKIIGMIGAACCWGGRGSAELGGAEGTLLILVILALPGIGRLLKLLGIMVDVVDVDFADAFLGIVPKGFVSGMSPIVSTAEESAGTAGDWYTPLEGFKLLPKPGLLFTFGLSIGP